MRRQLVVFRVGESEFGIDILLTKEVVTMREITPVPETEDFVEGVMNLRGNLVPVLDLRKRLRARTAGAHADRRILIAHLDDRLVGLIVDRASEVVRLEEANIEPPPDIISESGAEYISGVANLGDRFITLIDLNKALSEEIVCELDRVMDALSGAKAGAVSTLKAV
ncbi:MAG TPA: chemotaxis protein CheW [Blastocatellia bacterium]|nr:chemotaxis protein CheW [Blastocatellia bacterium]